MSGKELRKRKSHRLPEYDYGKYGYYFVTICTNHRIPLLSKITPVGSDAPVVPQFDAAVIPESLIVPTSLGNKVVESFKKIETLNENVKIDKFVLMPNHIHAIIIIENTDPIETIEKQYAFQISERRGRRSLQGLIKDFKSVTTRYYKKTFGTNESLWQESFYDEVIKSYQQYESVWNYINENPLKWNNDDYFKL